MSEVTVKQLASTVGIPIEGLLRQLREAGISADTAEYKLTQQEKIQLLGYLRRYRGKDTEKSTQRQRLKTVSVGVRRKSPVPIKETDEKQIPIRKVFVSYSWDNPGHISWVKKFASRLRTDGVEAILDRWELHPGDPVTEFMENSITNADFVILILTPSYRERANLRKGGVGYEGTIITGEIYSKANHRKFIPILRKGTWNESSPTYAASKLYIDMRDIDEDREEFGYRDLLLTILGRREAAPPLGKVPETL